VVSLVYKTQETIVPGIMGCADAICGIRRDECKNLDNWTGILSKTKLGWNTVKQHNGDGYVTMNMSAT